MRTSRSLLIVGGVAVVLLSACGSDDAGTVARAVPTTAAPTTEAMTDEMPDETTDETTDESMTDESMVDVDHPMADLAAWQTLEITDVEGRTFTLADHIGTPVFVEPFATWCPNCREQLERTQEAAAELGDEAVVVALSVETDLDPGRVADYAADHGLVDIRFAVMSPELLAAIADDLGRSAINPPSTPHVVIAASGAPGELSTGAASPDDIVASVRTAAGA